MHGERSRSALGMREEDRRASPSPHQGPFRRDKCRQLAGRWQTALSASDVDEVGRLNLSRRYAMN
jgi:hypothetical protein